MSLIIKFPGKISKAVAPELQQMNQSPDATTTHMHTHTVTLLTPRNLNVQFCYQHKLWLPGWLLDRQTERQTDGCLERHECVRVCQL